MYFAIGMAKNAEMCEKTGRSVLRRIQSLPLGAKFVLIEVEYRGELISPRKAIFRKRNAESAVLPLHNSASRLALDYFST